MKKNVLWTLAAFLFINASGQKFENVADTPPMGWNSWNYFQCDGINEEVIKGIADALVLSGMKDAGYEYVVIDDCWQVGRDEDGNIIADAEKFPSGIKALADYVHSKGLKFGLYSDAGIKTCQKRPGSRGYEFQDARTYAAWGVDYLKYDWCNTGTQNSEASYKLMRDALYKAGRPVVFSLCEWGRTKPWEWAEDIGHLWRTTGDILDRWDAMIAIVDKNKDLAKYAGPGHWNDPDMLEVGNGGMTHEEYITHFSLWCMLAAPLMAGNDLRDMTPETAEILTNEEMISVNQDVLGKQGFCFRDNDGYEIWVKTLANDEKAVCLLNRSDEIKRIQVDFSLLLVASNDYWHPDPYEREDYRLRNLWEHENLEIPGEPVYLEFLPHSVKVFRFIRKE